MKKCVRSWPSFGAIFDLSSLQQQIDFLTAKTSDPDFWKDPNSAQKVLSEKGGIEKRLKRFLEIEQCFEEAALLIELAESENDTSLESEIAGHLKTLRVEIDRFYIETHLSGEKDINSAIVTIHPGAGGTESQDWAEMLTRMYLRWAERRGYPVQTLDLQAGDEAGIKSVTFVMKAPYTYGYMKGELGIHRLVRISPFDAAQRRHTSFASVFVSPEIADDPDVVLNEKDLRIDTYRASSAGGQHVNKTSSAIRITHIPTGTVTQCQNERSQHQNKAVAMMVLKSRLYELQQIEKQEAMSKLTGEKKQIGWGHQIRSYVFQPYQMVKDHRTGVEIGNVAAVMNGEIDPFIEGHLKHR